MVVFLKHSFLKIRPQSNLFFDWNHEGSYWKSCSFRDLASILKYCRLLIFRAHIILDENRNLLWSMASNRLAFFIFSLLFLLSMKNCLSFLFQLSRAHKPWRTWFINHHFFNWDFPKTLNETECSFWQEHLICKFLILSVSLMQPDAFPETWFSRKSECASMMLL